MRQNHLTLLMFMTALFSVFLCERANSADPAKDPKGWRNLKFGMSPEEVLLALGDEAYVEAKKEGASPELAYTMKELEINEIRDKAKKILITLKNDEDAVSVCREFLRNSRTITWKPNPSGSQSWPHAFGRLQSIKGTIESYKQRYTDGLGGGTVDICKIKVGNRFAEMPIKELDETTRKKTEQIVQLAKDIDEMRIEKEPGLAHKNQLGGGDDPQLTVNGENLRSKPLTIRGIVLKA